jgi:hypothetical protein
MGKIMKKVLIFTALAVLLIFLASCQGKLVQLTATPDFGDGKTDDSVIPDDDSGDSGNSGNSGDSGNTGDTGDTGDSGDEDSFTDEDEDEDEVPDEIGVECEPEGEKKCNGAKTSILECAEGVWVTNQTCENNETCDDTREAILCAPHICVPATTYCKLGNVYTCANDGLSGEMTEDCTDTQYCDDTKTPVDCTDMICVPNDIFCETNVLKECNAKGSASSTIKECGTGVCDEGLENCVFTGEVGGTEKFDRTGQRGNFFNCTKNVKVVEFNQQLEYTGSKDLSWAIYEAEGSSTTYSRIFIKNATTTGTGKAYYSTGTISVNLVSGKKYIFATGWSGTSTVYYGQSTSEIGFGTAVNAHSLGSSSMAESLANPTRYDIIFNQQIKFVE